MYPECLHGITLRIWGDNEVISVLSERLLLTVENRGEREPKRPYAVYRFSERKTGNVEEEINLLLDIIRSRADIISFTQNIEAWIVISVEEFSVLNVQKSTSERLYSMNISISIENHT